MLPRRPWRQIELVCFTHRHHVCSRKLNFHSFVDGGGKDYMLRLLFNIIYVLYLWARWYGLGLKGS